MAKVSLPQTILVLQLLSITGLSWAYLEVSGDHTGYLLQDTKLNISLNFKVPGDAIIEFNDGLTQDLRSLSSGNSSFGLGTHGLSAPAFLEAILYSNGRDSNGAVTNSNKTFLQFNDRQSSILTSLSGNEYILVNTTVKFLINIYEYSDPFFFVDDEDKIRYWDSCNGSFAEIMINHTYQTVGARDITLSAGTINGGFGNIIKLWIVSLENIGLTCDSLAETGKPVNCTLDIPTDITFAPNSIQSVHDINCTSIDSAVITGGNIPFTCTFDVQGDFVINVTLLSLKFGSKSLKAQTGIWNKIEMVMRSDKNFITVNETTNLRFENSSTQGINYRLKIDEVTQVEVIDEAKFYEPYILHAITTRPISFPSPGNFSIKLDAWNRVYNISQELSIVVQIPIPELITQLSAENGYYSPTSIPIMLHKLDVQDPDPTDASCELDFGDGSPSEDISPMTFDSNGLAHETNHFFTSAGNFSIIFRCWNLVSNQSALHVVGLEKLILNVNLSSVLVPFDDSTNKSTEVTIGVSGVPTSLGAFVMVEINLSDGTLIKETAQSFPVNRFFFSRTIYSLTWTHTYNNITTTHPIINITVGLVDLLSEPSSDEGLIKRDGFEFDIQCLSLPSNMIIQWSNESTDNFQVTDSGSIVKSYIFQSPGQHIVTITSTSTAGVDRTVRKYQLHNTLDDLQMAHLTTYQVNKTIEIKATVKPNSIPLTNISCTFQLPDGNMAKNGNVSGSATDITLTTSISEPVMISFLADCSSLHDSKSFTVNFTVTDGCFNSTDFLPPFYKDVLSPLKLYLPTEKILSVNPTPFLREICLNKTLLYSWKVARNSSNGFVDSGLTLPSEKDVPFASLFTNEGLFKISFTVESTDVIIDKVMDEMYVYVSNYPLVAKIEGASLKQSVVGSPLTLSATKFSYDPIVGFGQDNTLNFAWSCFIIPQGRSGYEFVRPGNSDKNFRSFSTCGISFSNSGVFTTNPGPNFLNKTVIFEVKVSKNNREAYHHVAIFFADPNKLLVDIRCEWNCLEKIISSDYLLLKPVLTCPTCTTQELEDAQYTWRLSKLNITDGATDEILTWPPQIKSGKSSPVFEANAGAFDENQGFYILLAQCRVGSSKTGEATFVLNINKKPYDGDCSLTPPEGTAGETLFDVICENWKDEGNRFERNKVIDLAEPVFYTVEQKIQNKFFTRYEGGRSEARNLQLLSCPKEDLDTCSIIVKISDMFKASVSKEILIKVSSPVFNSSSSISDFAASLVGTIDKNSSSLGILKDVGSALYNLIKATEIESIGLEELLNISNSEKAITSIIQTATTVDRTRKVVEKVVDDMVLIIDDAIASRGTTDISLDDIVIMANSLTAATQDPNVIAHGTQLLVLKNANTLVSLLDDQLESRVVLAEVMSSLKALASLTDRLISIGSPSILDFGTGLDISSLDPSKAIDVKEGYNVIESDFYKSLMTKKNKVLTAFKISNAKESVSTISSAVDVIAKVLKATTTVGNNNTMETDMFRVTVLKYDPEDLAAISEIDGFSFKGVAKNMSSEINLQLTTYKANVFVHGQKSPLITSNVVVAQASDVDGNVIPLNEPKLTFEDPLADYYTYIKPEFIPDDASEMIYFRFIYRDTSELVCIALRPTEPLVKYRIFWRSLIPPTDQEYDTEQDPDTIQSIDGEYQACSKSGDLKRKGIAFAGVKPYIDEEQQIRRKRSTDNKTIEELLKSDVHFRLLLMACFSWDDQAVEWDSNLCEFRRDAVNGRTECLCGNKYSNPTAVSFYVPPNTIDFPSVFSKFDIQSQAAVLGVILVCTVVAILCALWGHWKDKQDTLQDCYRLKYLEVLLLVSRINVSAKKDKQDTLQWGVTLLADNYADDHYFYLITVYTGNRRGAKTRSKVSFNLSGDNDETGIRVLSDGVRNEFSAGSVMHFLMSTPHTMGPLQYLHIWHDNSGKGNDASWFLEKVEIRDLQTKEKFVFPCSIWLSIEEGTLEKALPLAGYEDMSFLKSVFYKYAASRIADDHIWLSLVLRPVKSHFTRVQRVFCCYTLLMLTMIANAMFYDTVPNKGRQQPADFSFGLVKLNTQDLYVSLVSVAITAIPTYFIMVLFQKSKLNFKKQEKVPSCVPPFYKKVYEDSVKVDKILVMKGLVDDEDGVLPHCVIYIAWFLIVSASSLSAFFLLLFSIQWGQTLSELWLTSFFLSIFESIVLVDPFKVLILAFTLALFVKLLKKQKPTKFDLADIKEIVKRRGKVISGRRRLIYNSPFLASDIASAKVKRQKDVIMQRASKELVLNALFVWILFSISFSNRSPLSYTLKTHITNQLLHPPKGYMTFDMINNGGHYFTWLNETVIPTLFSENYYNGQDFSPLERLLISDFTNYKVGPPRLRQLRVVKANCSIPYLTTIPCIDPYETSIELTADYCRGWKDGPCSDEEILSFSNEAWKYVTATNTWGLPIAGIFALYGGGGYIADLDINRIVAESALEELHENLWIDRSTRAVFLEFTVFNVNLNLFAYVSILAEFPETGSVLKFTNIYPFRISHGIQTIGAYIFLCEIVFVVMTFYMAVSTVMKISRNRSAYFKNFWNVVELVCLMVSILAIILYLVRLDYTQQAIARFEENKRQFVNFYHVVVWENAFVYVLAFLVAIATLRLLKVMGYTKRTMAVYLVLKESSSILPGFVFYVILALTSFSALGFFLFGRNATQYKDLITALETGFRGMLGDASFKKTETTVEDSWITTLYFVAFVWIIILTLSNLFLAIFLDVMTIADESRQKNRNEGDLEIFDYIWSNFTNIIYANRGNGSTSQSKSTILEVNSAIENIWMNMSETKRKHISKWAGQDIFHTEKPKSND